MLSSSRGVFYSGSWNFNIWIRFVWNSLLSSNRYNRTPSLIRIVTVFANTAANTATSPRSRSATPPVQIPTGTKSRAASRGEHLDGRVSKMKRPLNFNGVHPHTSWSHLSTSDTRGTLDSYAGGRRIWRSVRKKKEKKMCFVFQGLSVQNSTQTAADWMEGKKKKKSSTRFKYLGDFKDRWRIHLTLSKDTPVWGYRNTGKSDSVGLSSSLRGGAFSTLAAWLSTDTYARHHPRTERMTVQTSLIVCFIWWILSNLFRFHYLNIAPLQAHLSVPENCERMIYRWRFCS